MRAIIPTQSVTLKKLLSSGSYSAKLFTNDLGDCKDLPVNFEFTEPNFIGYSSKLLDPNLWVLSSLTSDYSQCDYNKSLIWGNTDASPTEFISGYFVADDMDNVLWFGKFDNPVIVEQNQNVLVDIRVYLNNYDYPENTIAIVVKGEIIKPQNVNIVVENIKWGGVDYPNILMDLMQNDWIPNQNVLCLGIDNTINICHGSPLSFDMSVTATDCIEHVENIIIEDPGNRIIEINLQSI